jgi:hypothetical protein
MSIKMGGNIKFYVKSSYSSPRSKTKYDIGNAGAFCVFFAARF